MLVLSRQKNQTIMIGDNIEITVIDVRGDKVRLGITAPTHIPVHRKEVYEAIKRENKAAATVTLADITEIPPAKPAKEKPKPQDVPKRTDREKKSQKDDATDKSPERP